MPRFEDSAEPFEVEASLAVIDATLAGETVPPEDAELAELTLILAGERPVPSAKFSAELDDRVARRFAPDPASESARRPRGRWRRQWLYASGAAAALAAVIAVVAVLSAGSSETMPSLLSAPASSTGSAAAAPQSATAATPQSATAAASSAAPGAPSPPTAGRQVVQSAQLSLSTRPGRVDDVAQHVFQVVSGQNGVVDNSTVTANGTASGYAQFQLSVPSSNFQATMAALSTLRGAAVSSRTDSSQDITGQVGGAGRALADARALRTALLRRLATATTSTQIGSLQVQIRDAERSIDSDLATLRSLHRKVDLTQISLTINASMAPGSRVPSGRGFTIGRAAHDAGRVLVVAAGVALIALAALAPLALLVAVIAWLALTIRRRRREQALDLG